MLETQISTSLVLTKFCTGQTSHSHYSSWAVSVTKPSAAVIVRYMQITTIFGAIEPELPTVHVRYIRPK